MPMGRHLGLGILPISFSRSFSNAAMSAGCVFCESPDMDSPGMEFTVYLRANAVVSPPSESWSPEAKGIAYVTASSTHFPHDSRSASRRNRKCVRITSSNPLAGFLICAQDHIVGQLLGHQRHRDKGRENTGMYLVDHSPAHSVCAEALVVAPAAGGPTLRVHILLVPRFVEPRVGHQDQALDRDQHLEQRRRLWEPRFARLPLPSPEQRQAYLCDRRGYVTQDKTLLAPTQTHTTLRRQAAWG